MPSAWPPPLTSARDAPVAYLTDVEGMWPRLESFAVENPLVRWVDDRLEVAPGAMFVFGGDAIDRGPGGRRVVRALLEVKQRQPEQVVLLAGNRDVNKLRLRRELLVAPHPRAPRELFDPRHTAPSELLKWTFSQTMGAGAAFENRRAELGAERGGAAVPDDAVTRSFLDDLAPDGELTRYIQACQLVFRAGPTIFVHGCLTREGLGHLPWDPVQRDDLAGWAEELNGWYCEQLQAYAEERLDAEGDPAWREVVAYQAPLPGTRLHPQSVVYSRLADANLNPSLPPAEVLAHLQRQGIGRLVVGHTPSGDSPTLLRSSDFEMIIADNSHARLPTASRVLIRGPQVDIAAAAILDDGARRDLAFTTRLGEPEPRAGMRDPATGRLLKGPTAQGDLLLWRGMTDYRVEQTTVGPEAAQQTRWVEPR